MGKTYKDRKDWIADPVKFRKVKEQRLEVDEHLKDFDHFRNKIERGVRGKHK